MADTTRMVTDSAQPFIVGDKIWRGVDTYNDPNKLETGYAETISNLQLDGGSLVLRNGWQGLLQPTELNGAGSDANGVYEMVREVVAAYNAREWGWGLFCLACLLTVVSLWFVYPLASVKGFVNEKTDS